jgi:predicted TPR repeat methyltransferase
MFDRFSDSFDEQLVEQLDYRAPSLVGEMLGRLFASDGASLDILDAGCGTGLCAEHLRSFARTLTGVDLSTGMLEKASRRGGYDQLREGELTAFLEQNPASYDAVVSADTLVYIGELDPVMKAAKRALRPGGILVFTTECGEGDGYSIGPHGRYSHSERYLRRVLDRAGFEITDIGSDILRTEATRPVKGYLVSARVRSQVERRP